MKNNMTWYIYSLLRGAGINFPCVESYIQGKHMDMFLVGICFPHILYGMENTDIQNLSSRCFLDVVWITYKLDF